jgi:hypothetical protein
VLAKVFEPAQHGEAAARRRLQRGVMQGQSQASEQPGDAFEVGGREQPGTLGVARVEQHADGHRFPVPQLVPAQDLELVRRPVAVVERARAAHLERIAPARDVFQVQGRAAADQGRERLRLCARERVRVSFDPGEERGVTDQRDLDRFGHTGARVAQR